MAKSKAETHQTHGLQLSYSCHTLHLVQVLGEGYQNKPKIRLYYEDGVVPLCPN